MSDEWKQFHWWMVVVWLLLWTVWLQKQIYTDNNDYSDHHHCKSVSHVHLSCSHQPLFQSQVGHPKVSIRAFLAIANFRFKLINNISYCTTFSQHSVAAFIPQRQQLFDAETLVSISRQQQLRGHMLDHQRHLASDLFYVTLYISLKSQHSNHWPVVSKMSLKRHKHNMLNFISDAKPNQKHQPTDIKAHWMT